MVDPSTGDPKIEGSNTVASSQKQSIHMWFFSCCFKRVRDQGPDQRESNLTVLCLLIIIILISYIIIKLLIVENHPSQNWKRNSKVLVDISDLKRNNFDNFIEEENDFWLELHLIMVKWC